jgi:spermidine synthase
VAVVGLGAGSMAAYSQTNQHWTYYEIDPTVIRIAQNSNYFPFLAKCGSGNFEFALGDARLRLREASPSCYGLLVLDAFSSDAIPVHLLTREALRLYLSKLADNGLLGSTSPTAAWIWNLCFTIWRKTPV